MGPQGLESETRLGFLFSTWNRRLDGWDLGSVADFRFEQIHLPNGTTTEFYEGLAFPLEFKTPKSFWSRFLGLNRFTTPVLSSTVPMAGYYGNIGPLTLSFQSRA